MNECVCGHMLGIKYECTILCENDAGEYVFGNKLTKHNKHKHHNHTFKWSSSQSSRWYKIIKNWHPKSALNILNLDQYIFFTLEQNNKDKNELVVNIFKLCNWTVHQSQFQCAFNSYVSSSSNATFFVCSLSLHRKLIESNQIKLMYCFNSFCFTILLLWNVCSVITKTRVWMGLKPICYTSIWNIPISFWNCKPKMAQKRHT